MYTRISFSVGKKTISFYGQELLLGELSIQIMNIPHSTKTEMYDLLIEGETLSDRFEDTRDSPLLDRAQDCYQKLEDKLRRYPLLALLLDSGDLLPNLSKLNAPRSYYIPACLGHAREALDSILIFRKAIGHLIQQSIMPMKKLTEGNISNAAAVLNSELYRMYIPKRDELDFCPYQDGLIELTFETVASGTGSNDFQVIEQYTAGSLLTLLRIDFFKALSAGHLIRQCEYCGRFFLLTKRLHTKYCDNPAPNNSKFTCAQMGYQKSRKKEQPEDDPKAESLRRCLNRITQDCSRKVITAEDRDLLKEKAKELYHDAKIRSGVTYEAFETSLASRNLYPLCKVKRRSNPVGHPKTEKVG